MKNKKPLPIYPFPCGRGPYEITQGEHSETVSFLQLVLNRLSDFCDGMKGSEISGIFDETNESDVCAFQKICGLPVTGRVDLVTWNRMAESFEEFGKIRS